VKIKVLSRQAMKEFQSDEKYLVISITDPNSEDAIIGDKDNMKSILTLQFHDVDKPLVKREKCTTCNGTGYLPQFLNINDGHCYRCTDKIDIRLFTDNDARIILDFVQDCRIDIDLIVVHCEAGISRSAGVAGALSLIYNGSDEYYFHRYLPNIFVYRKILNMYMRSKK